MQFDGEGFLFTFSRNSGNLDVLVFRMFTHRWCRHLLSIRFFNPSTGFRVRSLCFSNYLCPEKNRFWKTKIESISKIIFVLKKSNVSNMENEKLARAPQ